jgi:uncharacterized protein involved in response to NO
VSGPPSASGAFRKVTALPIFSYGFRTFFLLAGVAALALVGAWIALGFGGGWRYGLSAVGWHAHEMLFGFVAAAVAGFLLTAAPSWTGTPALSGAPLIALAGLWLAGRIASHPQVSASLLCALVDLAFFPALAASLAMPLWKAGKWRNIVFLLLITALACGNLLMRLEWMGATVDTASAGIALTVGIVLLMVTVIGGRILPSFTQNALRRHDPAFAIPTRSWLDRAAILATAAMIPADLTAPGSMAAGGLAGLAALAHALRLAGWSGPRTLREPLLWVLHLGYAWLPVALAMKAIAIMSGAAAASGWLHALTVGGFSTMILAVMTRAALGHTGRELRPSPVTVLAYLSLLVAAVTRSFAAALPSGLYDSAIRISAIAWILAFASFLFVYAPILTRPRADAQPG